MPFLGVNIDHVATIRQARREIEPDPVEAALVCQKAGADSIVAHLREDRRHINDGDIARLREVLTVRFNMEMSINKSIVDIACRVKPDQVTLVPERRCELTTEGGLDVVANYKKISRGISLLRAQGIAVSIFIDPVKQQLDACVKLGVTIVELHTGAYAGAGSKLVRDKNFVMLKSATAYGAKLGLTVNAGHGLKYNNAYRIAAIPSMHELNIGHSIITRAVFVGLPQAVREMKAISILNSKGLE